MHKIKSTLDVKIDITKKEMNKLNYPIFAAK
jgi:hypothetical protein